jgi:hypothetical protein
MQNLISKITRAKMAGGVAQAVEHLLNKCKALSSNPHTMAIIMMMINKTEIRIGSATLSPNFLTIPFDTFSTYLCPFHEVKTNVHMK